MKPTKRNTILRAENNEFDSEGLGSRMDKFFAESDAGGEQPPVGSSLDDTPEPKEDDEPEPINQKLDPNDDDPTKKDDDSADESEEDEDFPEIGNKDKTGDLDKPDGDSDAEGFNEDEFDKQTEDEVKGMDAKAGEKWKQLKSELKDLKKTIQESEKAAQNSKPSPEIEAELSELRQKAEEAETLRQRNEELLKANDRVAVEESEEYKTKVKGRFTEMENIIKDIADYTKINPEEFFKIVTEPDIAKQDAAIEDLNDKIGNRMASRIGRIADDYKEVNSVKKQMLDNATKTLEANRIAQQQAQEQEREQSRRAFKSASQESFTKYASKVPSLVDSNGNLNDAGQEIMRKTAAIDPSSLDSSDLGYMAFCANAFPEARKHILKLEKELKMAKIASGSNQDSTSRQAPAREVSDNASLAEVMQGKEFTFTPPN